MIKLIVGLGNPGENYTNTRHNIGFMTLDKFTSSRNVKFDKQKFSGVYAEELINGDKIIYLKPQKYMNLSGEVVKDFVNYFKIEIENILIINDDLNLPVGKVRLRSKGSSGGHNGLKNIELHLGTQGYKRLKIGIGNEFKNDMKDFVLGKFTKSEMEILEKQFSETNEILLSFLNEKFENLMCKYN